MEPPVVQVPPAKPHMRRSSEKIGCLVAAIVAPVVFVVALIALANRMAHAPSANCENNIRIIRLAARTWAAEAGTKELPSDLLKFTNEISSPKWLHCPADEAHPMAVSWADFAPSNCSYALSPGVDDGTTNGYVRCTHHHHVGTADGSVFLGTHEKWSKSP